MLLRGMRWRLGGSVLTVLTAAIAVSAAILGPLYLHTAGDSLVRSTVAAAPSSATRISFAATNGANVSLTRMRAERDSLTRRFELDRWYGKPVTTVSSGLGLSVDKSPLSGELLYRSGMCRLLKFKAGGCHLGPGDVLLSVRSAHEMQVALGSTVSATVRGSSKPLKLHVTGIYIVPSLTLPAWFGDGRDYFPYGYPTGPAATPQVDGLIASKATALNVPALEIPSVRIDEPIVPGAVNLGDENQIKQALSGARKAAAAQNVELTTQIPELLAAADHQRHLMTTIVAVAAVQLVLLAIWVLAALLLRSADERRSELRVARLRGFPLLSILAVTVIEPALLCAAGAVIGVVLAWIAVVIAKNGLLDPAATVSVDIWTVAGFASALLTICMVLGISALRLLRGSELGRPSATTAAGAGRSAVIFDVAILVLTIVALVALATSGTLASHNNPIAAAAPGLLSLGIAVVAIRLVQFVCRRGIGLTADSRAVAGFLALRQTVRRPALLRESRVLIIALGLACFAICAWSVARSNRSTAATFSVGASTVLTVHPQNTTLERAVDRVDPSGRFAMAAVQVKTSSANLIGVDAARLPQVASWPGGTTHASVEQVSRALRPDTPSVLELGSRSISMSASVKAGGGAGAQLKDLALSAWVFNSKEGTTIVSLGPLRAGTHSYSGSLATLCPGGCQLSGIGAVPLNGRGAASSGHLALTVTKITTASGPVPASDFGPHDWRSATSGIQVSTSSAGVALSIPAGVLSNFQGASGPSTSPMAAYADYPANIPGVVGPTAAASASELNGQTTISAQGIDGNTVSIGVALQAASLPRIGRDGEMVDLKLLKLAQIDPALPTVSDEVWLGPSAPPNAISRLKDAGLEIENIQQSSTVFAQLQRSGPALAYDFMLFATIVALLAAAVSTLGVLIASRRQRAAELSALEVAGVGRPTLLRSLAIESTILAFTALFGAAAGAVGAALAIPSLPQLSGSAFAPLSYALPPLLIVLVSLCVVLVVAITTAIATGGIVSRMSPSLLRAGSNDLG